MRRLLIVGVLLMAALSLSYKLKPYGLLIHSVLSESMGQSAPRGSLVLARRVQPAEYKVGDIVIIPLPGTRHETVIHRIVGIEQTQDGHLVSTKGDANPNGDGWRTPLALVEGRAEVVVPYIGYLPLWLQHPVGFSIFALLSFLLIVWPALRVVRAEVG
jgi:signal peptidase I